MRRRLFALLFSALLLASVLVSAPAEAAKPALPGNITSVSARPGPGVGQITFSWKQDGSHTTSFRLETALTSFSKTNPSMLKSGRRSRLTNISASRRSVTLSAAQVTSDGGGVASGNSLYYRFYALDSTRAGTTTRAYPYLGAVLPRPEAPKARGTSLRIATFNVRTARATGDKQSWLRRAPAVAAEIIAHNPGVVAIQELGPGRADGKAGTLNGHIRQTDSLKAALRTAHGSKYQLVRTTPYVKPGVPSSTQGARILFDSSRYTLLTRCPETTAGHSYSGSCSIPLPLLAKDSESFRRTALMAQFRDRKTGQRFWMVSAHLDARHSANTAQEARYDALRGAQARAITARVAHFNTRHVPVVIGGDFNSWQNNKVGNAPHDTLIGQGYYDTSAALTRVNFTYSTYNEFKTTMPSASQGIGVRLDMLLVKGARGSRRFENVMKVKDTSRPSDHNLVLSDIVL